MNRRTFLGSALAPLAPLDRRVEALLVRMTLEEKAGQMNMSCVYVRELGRTPEARREACRKFTEGTLAKFPEGPSLGSTWNPQLLERLYAAVAEEARAVGIHQLFTPVVEATRDPRLGRNEEGYSEDQYLCARIAEAIVTGIQGNDISRPDKAVAGLCHYPGQGEPASGLERGAMAFSERMVREVLLRPWIAGIRKKGALGVMANGSHRSRGTSNSCAEIQARAF